jgi:putative spermidine/putrescine transport system permease protein
MPENILTMDDARGLALQVRRARRRPALLAWALVMPAMLYLGIVFVFPIAVVLYRGVSNGDVGSQLPLTAEALTGWNEKALPGDAVANALVADLKANSRQNIAAIARELNNRVGGYRSLMIKTRRAADDLQAGSGMAVLVSIDPRWREPGYWLALRDATRTITPYYILASLDLRQAPDGAIERAPQERRVYLQYLLRTFSICAVVTLLCALVGYPVAYFISQAKAATQKLLIFALLIPFWTSVLVRTAAWVILLQKNGIVNDMLTGIGLIDSPLTLMYNRFAVYVAMTHVLLPFMVLPLFSVMKSIPPHLVRAALSLGATPAATFRQVYLPLSLPGLTAGATMVFILGLGYYVTPALVGGPGDQMESGLIAHFALEEGNWQMASATSFILLALTGGLFLAAKRFLNVANLPG